MFQKEIQRKPRTRAPNFSKQDQTLLFQVMKPYMKVIESKKTDYVKQTDKHIAWEKITEIYNANSTGHPRSSDNLLACYRNVKGKLKNQQSEAKMLLVDPVQRGALVKAIEEVGDDWAKVAEACWNDPQLCEQGFEELKKETIKEDNKKKKNVMGTGGGPYVPDNNDLSEIKKMIAPQMDGMFTVYDGDAKLMEQFQQTLPEAERAEPIEASFIQCTENQDIIMDELEETPKPKSRLDILRKKKEPALSHNGNLTYKKPKVNESYINLSEAKLELVQLQKCIAEMDIQHKQKIQEIEIGEMIKENIFREKMRQKELELMDIKIENAKKQS